jgi:glucokinase
VDKITVGVDLGGTKIKAALVGDNGRILYSVRKLTNAAKGSESVITALVEAVRECLREAKATAVGVGIAGQIDSQSGDVLFAPNLSWRHVPVRSELQRRLGLPVLIINDVRAATVGEWTYGAGPQTDHMVCLFIGTGIGGGAVMRGQVVEGCNNSAGELGHMTIVANGRRCRCPNLGCLEAYAGGWAIAERAQEAIQEDLERGKRILEIATSLEGVTAKSVSIAYTEGDPLARQIVEQTAGYLAAGIVATINAFNPCALVLGGGVIGGIPALLDLAEPQIRRRALPSATSRLKILRSSLGTNSGCIGAAVLARSVLMDEAP